MNKLLLLSCLVPLSALGSCKFLYKRLVDYTEFWPNGLPKSRGTLNGDKQAGDWTLSYESGKPLAKGSYQDDRQVGPWTFYYENGGVEREGSFDDKGLRTGEWLYKYEDQTPKARGSYIADFEDGPWTFYGADGAVAMQGQYDAGKQSGLWRFHYAGGQPKAEGIYHKGDRVGPWQVWSENGASRIQDFGKKAGVVLVRELWPGTNVVRRVGVLENGKAVGRWTSYHPNGALRCSCGLANGAPNGVFEARDPDGHVLAQGAFANGAIAAGGVAVNQGVSRPLAAGQLQPVPADVQPWAEFPAMAAMPVEVKVAAFVAEAKAAPAAEPYAAVVLTPAEQPTAAQPAPSAEAVVEQIDAGPMRVPAAAQPQLTVKQRQEMESYIAEYTDGPKAGGGSLFSNYAPDVSRPRPQGQGERSEWVGKPLPFTKMLAVDGGEVDLAQYRGKRQIMIVVLRGFLGEVCCYCIAQTKALAKARDKLAKANVEVLVIYPGPKENEQSFRQLYSLEFGEGPPPYRVFYDPGLELVTQLGIAGDLAFPSTFIVDKQGIVRYAYVGEHRADRPATKKLIEIIEGMQQ